MIKELNNLVEYDGGSCLDTLISVAGPNTDGSFVIHHFLSTFLKNEQRVVFLSLAQTFGHFQAVAQKLGTNLSLAQSSGELSHIDGLSFSLDAHHDGTQPEGGGKTILGRCARSRSLRPLYEEITSLVAAHISSHPSSTISVVIDDLSMLMSLGFSAQQLSQFVHYLKVNLKKISGNLVVLVHRNVSDDESILLDKTLAYRADVRIDIGGLASGFSKEVHGSLSVIHSDTRDVTSSRRKAKHVQYKILDKTVSIFPIGTAVL